METKTWSGLTTFLILLLAVILLIGLFCVSFSASIALLLGVFLAWLIHRITSVQYRRWFARKLVIRLLTLLIVTFIAFLLLRYLPGAPTGVLPSAPLVKKYTVIIEPKIPKSFSIQEKVIIALKTEDVLLDLPRRQISSTPRGFLLQEIHFMPLQMSTGSTLTLPDGTSLHGPLCTYECPESSIELRNMPRNSFYAGKDSTNLKNYPYIDTETITWSVGNLEQGVTFAYIPTPYPYLRPVLSPLIGLSSFGPWVIGVLTGIATFALSSVVSPVLLDIAKGKFKSQVEQVIKRKPITKTTIIISGEGEEKEIEITDDRPR